MIFGMEIGYKSGQHIGYHLSWENEGFPQNMITYRRADEVAGALNLIEQFRAGHGNEPRAFVDFREHGLTGVALQAAEYLFQEGHSSCDPLCI